MLAVSLTLQHNDRTMSESIEQLAASVDEVLASFEWGSLGFREYYDITVQAQSLQDDLLDHLQTFDHLGEYDEQEETAMVYALNRLVEQDFNHLQDLECGDEVLATGSGLIVVVEATGEYGVVPINDEIRLHGRIAQPVAMEVPALESIPADGEDGEILSPLSAALELENVSVEDLVDDESKFTDLPDDMRFFCR